MRAEERKAGRKGGFGGEGRVLERWEVDGWVGGG